MNIKDKQIPFKNNSDFSAPISYNDENWDYTYDVYNRMYDVDKDDADIANYTFNALGNRVMKYVNAGTVTTKMLYDGADCVADYDSFDSLLRYYITPFLDENLILNNSSEDFYFTHDGLGSVRQIIDSSQNTENDYDFYAFGTSNTSTETITNRFKFTGRELDSETTSANSKPLYYYRARTYDSELGSFTGRDPVPYINLYSYCFSNPVNYIDSLGDAPYNPVTGEIVQSSTWDRTGSLLGGNIETGESPRDDATKQEVNDTAEYENEIITPEQAAQKKTNKIRDSIYEDNDGEVSTSQMCNENGMMDLASGVPEGANTLGPKEQAMAEAIGALFGPYIKIIQGLLDSNGVLVKEGTFDLIVERAISTATAGFVIGGGKVLKTLFKAAVKKSAKKTARFASNKPNKCSKPDPTPIDPEKKIKGGCFVAGTLILMADGGHKKIEDVEVGDEIQTFDFETNNIIICRVEKAYKVHANTIYDLHLSDGSIIEVTSEHPFFVFGKNIDDSKCKQSKLKDVLKEAGKKAVDSRWFDRKEFVGWISAKDLKNGYVLKTVDDILVSVEYLKIRYEKTVVYNLNISKTHNYFVLSKSIENSAAILVHNTSARPQSRKLRIKKAGLPNKGKIRYVPPKNYNHSNPLPRGNKGYLDKFGNEWQWDPIKSEWDVQLSKTGKAQLGWASNSGNHVNVSPSGEITH